MKKMVTYTILLLLNFPLFASAGIINLGNAEDYILAAANNDQWGGNLLLGSEAHIWGSVAASNTLELGGGVIVEGNACANTINNWGSVVTGVTGACIDFGQLAADITDAASQAQVFTGTYLGNVTESVNIEGSGVQSFIIDDLLLAGGESLTVTGSADDSFVFNVFGLAQLGSGASILLEGGITASNVFFNFVENNAMSSFEIGGANICGTFLSMGRIFILGDGATLNDSRFYSTESIVANVQDVSFINTPVLSVPEPSIITVFLFGLMGLALRGNKKQA